MKRLGLCCLGISLGLLLPVGGRAQTPIHNNVSDETVEKILQGLSLKFQKGERKLKTGAVSYYDFKRDDQAYRFYNYRSDLWIESHFDKKLKPEDVNRWNAEAKFSRAVLLDQKDKSIVSLESQVDCLGGITDPMIRQFINRFDEDAKKFVKSMPK